MVSKAEQRLEAAISHGVLLFKTGKSPLIVRRRDENKPAKGREC
jgi:hypothetical protein